MMTRSQFVRWLQTRRDAGETLTAIGDRLGVSHTTVTYWLSGKRNPSRMTLVLAGEICRAPVEMAPGLPSLQTPFKRVRHLNRDVHANQISAAEMR